MIVVVNGKDTELKPGSSLLELLQNKGVSPDTVVVECNGEIVPGELFSSTELNDGDHLEVLRFVGGG